MPAVKELVYVASLSLHEESDVRAWEAGAVGTFAAELTRV